MMSDAEALRHGELGAPLLDPFAQSLALETRDRRRFAVSLAVTLVLYALFVARGYAMLTELSAFASGVRVALDRRPVEYEVETEPPPPPPEPVPEPEPPAPEPPKAAPVKAPAQAPAAPRPAAAQAGKVMTAAPDPNEPVDLTGDGFVQGNADAYSGGVTSSTGTNKHAVYDPHAGGTADTPVAAKTQMVGSGVDLSRPPQPLSGSWDHCGFPAEADIEQINYARVTIAVTVGSDGVAKNASVVQDPGYGFGALAKRCALRERFQPARDKTGAAVTQTQLITINFKR
jgi:protein TonB